MTFDYIPCTSLGHPVFVDCLIVLFSDFLTSLVPTWPLRRVSSLWTQFVSPCLRRKGWSLLVPSVFDVFIPFLYLSMISSFFLFFPFFYFPRRKKDRDSTIFLPSAWTAKETHLFLWFLSFLGGFFPFGIIPRPHLSSFSLYCMVYLYSSSPLPSHVLDFDRGWTILPHRFYRRTGCPFREKDESLFLEKGRLVVLDNDYTCYWRIN